MSFSRRDCCLWMLPALLAKAQTAAKVPLPSKVYRFEDLPVRTNEQTKNSSRAVLDGETHDGFAIEAHETTLSPGSSPHPPHKHVHEEMFLIREGSLDVTISGRTTRLGPGGVTFVASNEEHGVRNPATSPAEYFVVALGAKKPA